MDIITITKTAFHSLRTNLARSLLTILGIIIGVMAIVLVVALGQGAQGLILDQVKGFGGNIIMLHPGRQPTNPNQATETVLSNSIKQREIDALRNPINVPDVASVDPSVLVTGAVTYQENSYRPTILGWTSSALTEMFQISPSEGTIFSDDDILQRNKVAVIGATVREKLFGQSDAVGKFIKIRDQNIRVIGVLPNLGQVSVFNVDELVLLPYSTAQKDILGINFFHTVFVSIKDGANVDLAASDIKTTLRDMHNIIDPEKDDFYAMTQKDVVNRLSTITQALTVFLAMIASISLVVGGIGIMNIMLVSVTERTREIGLRKALGATNSDILRQFLLEAVILTVSGGASGTILGISLAFITSVVLKARFGLAWPFQLPLSAIILGVGMAGVVGLVFGIYPARKAARKDPIEALRYE
ncbi:MAG: ABC transporter permease [bacterium]|nr:ABC transporter permease [bacterium]